MGDLVLHRLPELDRLSDRRGDSGRGGQAGASGGRVAGQCAAKDAGRDDSDDRAEPDRRSRGRGQPDGRLDRRTVGRAGVAQGARCHRCRGIPPDAGRNGGNLAAGRDCGRAARFRRGPADRPGGVRFRHYDAADGGGSAARASRATAGRLSSRATGSSRATARTAASCWPKAPRCVRSSGAHRRRTTSGPRSTAGRACGRIRR